MSSKGTKPRTKKDQAPEDQQREMDLQEIKKRTSSVAKEAEELLTGAANLAELPPVNDVKETAVQVPDSFLSLLDASHAANRKKLSTEQPKKGAKVTLEVERKTSDSSLGVAENLDPPEGPSQRHLAGDPEVPRLSNPRTPRLRLRISLISCPIPKAW